MDIKEVLLKRIDVRGLIIEDLLQGVVRKELQKIVDDSSNSYDDMLMAAVYPQLEKAASEFLDAQLAKLVEPKA